MTVRNKRNIRKTLLSVSCLLTEVFIKITMKQFGTGRERESDRRKDEMMRA